MNIGMWFFVVLAVIVTMACAWLRLDTEYLPSDAAITQQAIGIIGGTLGVSLCVLGFLIALLVHVL